MKRVVLQNIGLILVVLFVLAACKTTDPQVKLNKIKEIETKLEVLDYTFEALMANPMGGKPIHLTSSYTLKVSPDSVIAYLPYFGRAYSVSNPSEGGIKFTSTNFDYRVEEKKKGTTSVSIQINDNPENYKLSLLIGEMGNSTLYVSQNNKQAITFTGNIH